MFDHKNFSKILKKNKISSQKLSDILKDHGVTLGKDSVDAYRKGNVQAPRYDILSLVASLCNANVIDFFENRNEIKADIVKNELKNNLEEYLPLLPSKLIPHTIKQIKVTKGYPSVAERIVQEDTMNYATQIFIDKRMVLTAYQDKELEAVVMIGDSMSPYLQNDDIAIWHPTSEPLGDGRYVINTPHGLTVKKLKFMSDGSILLISENPDYNTNGTYDEKFSKDIADTLEIYGLVVGRILKS
jgi:SOS-response transcriptional repressor LexA